MPLLGLQRINSLQSAGNSKKESSSALQSTKGLFNWRYFLISEYLGHRPISGGPVFPMIKEDKGSSNFDFIWLKSKLNRQLEEITMGQGSSLKSSFKRGARWNRFSMLVVVECKTPSKSKNNNLFDLKKILLVQIDWGNLTQRDPIFHRYNQWTMENFKRKWMNHHGH